MKHQTLILILLLPLFAALTGCNNSTPTENMSNEDILNVLDIKIHKHPKDDNLYYDRAKIYLQLNRVNDAFAAPPRPIPINEKELNYNTLLADADFAKADVEQHY